MDSVADRGMTTRRVDMHALSMLLTASESESTLGLSIFWLIVGAGVLYAFGYARAVMHRANKDYKATKAALPGLRKGFWRSWWQAVKVFAAIVVFGLVVIVTMRAAAQDDAAPANPTPSVSRSTR